MLIHEWHKLRLRAGLAENRDKQPTNAVPRSPERDCSDKNVDKPLKAYVTATQPVNTAVLFATKKPARTPGSFSSSQNTNQ